MNLKVYNIRNKHGLTLEATNFGSRIISIQVPDRNGVFDDIVLGYDSASQYLQDNQYLGAVIGRFGNRIAGGKFSLDGSTYELAVNNGQNSLHGGPRGFHNVFWQRNEANPSPNRLEMFYLSKDGEEGYPGNLSVTMAYTLTDENTLEIDYHATTDKATIINLTHHSYFNLSGEGEGDILDTDLTIHADNITPVDQGLIPLGELCKVEGTPFDFRKAHKIGERVNSEDPQLRLGKGYDHNWVLNKKDDSLTLGARAEDPVSGRVLEVWTTEPGLQFYSGNFLNGNDAGKGGKRYKFRSGFCLEAQHFPDSPNQKQFPSTVLRPGEVYRQKTVYKFLNL